MDQNLVSNQQEDFNRSLKYYYMSFEESIMDMLSLNDLLILTLIYINIIIFIILN